jgi:hypothetical protein
LLRVGGQPTVETGKNHPVHKSWCVVFAGVTTLLHIISPLTL